MTGNIQALFAEDEVYPGILNFGGVRMILLDVDGGFWGLRRQIEGLVGKRMTNVLFQQAGVNGGASFARSFIDQMDPRPGSDIFRDCLSAFQTAGFGQFEVVSLKWPIGRLEVIGRNTFEAWPYRHNSTKQHEPVCAYTSGVLVGFINVISERCDVVCVKRQCQAQGDEFCQYELLPSGEVEDEPVIAFNPDPALGRQLNLLEILFDRMPMGIAIFNAELQLQRFNPTWEQLIERYVKIKEKNITSGQSLFNLFPGTENDFAPLLETLFSGEVVNKKAFHLKSNGASFYWDSVFTPLMDDNKIIGFMVVVVDATERILTQKDLEQRISERTHEISTLMQISHNIAITQELEPLLGLLLDDLKKIIDYDGSTILTIEGRKIVVRAYRGPLTWAQVSDMTFPLDDPLDSLVILSKDRVIIDDTTGNSHEAQAFRESVGDRVNTIFHHIRSWMGVPIIIKGEVIGHLAIEHHEVSFFNPQRADLVATFASQLAVVLENARLQIEARRAAVLDERQRIARDLHDSVSQALYGISLGTRTLQKLLDNTTIPEEILDKLEKPLDYVMSLASMGLDEMRALIFELHPDALEKDGLIVALERKSDILRTRHNIDVLLDLCHEPSMSVHEKEVLYRIAQEAMNNVIKHANARKVKIKLKEEEEKIVLEIQDDGVGFDPTVEYPGHLGLHSMNERVNQLGGELEINSGFGQGTQILTRIPTGQ